MKSNGMIENEETLLEEINRFACYCRDCGKPTDIVLTEKQFNTFKKICYKIGQGKVDRMNYSHNVDPKGPTYLGLNIRQKQVAKADPVQTGDFFQ